MPTSSMGLLQRPQINRSPSEGGYALPIRTRGLPPLNLSGLGETDFYLRRSYDIVERLRRAVEERGSK